MWLLKKTVDFRADDLSVKKSQPIETYVKGSLPDETGKVSEVSAWKLMLAMLLLPFLLLWKLLEVIHLLTFIVFGGLILYFGYADFSERAWGVNALYLVIGGVLVIAPVFYWFDQDK